MNEENVKELDENVRITINNFIQRRIDEEPVQVLREVFAGLTIVIDSIISKLSSLGDGKEYRSEVLIATLEHALSISQKCRGYSPMIPHLDDELQNFYKYVQQTTQSFITFLTFLYEKKEEAPEFAVALLWALGQIVGNFFVDCVELNWKGISCPIQQKKIYTALKDGLFSALWKEIKGRAKDQEGLLSQFIAEDEN